jgi:hypothetical protein
MAEKSEERTHHKLTISERVIYSLVHHPTILPSIHYIDTPVIWTITIIYTSSDKADEI